MRIFERILNRILGILVAIGFTCCMLMMMIVVVNIVTRPSGHAIIGTYEAVQLLIVVMVSFSLGYTALSKGHVNMDMVVTRLSSSTQKVFSIISSILGLIIWIMITWYSFQFSAEQLLINEQTAIAEFPIYPFRFIFALGAFITCLVMVLNTVKSIKES
jgi:TRAP-type C4-dicarboxylate transport system permease small subunit